MNGAAGGLAVSPGSVAVAYAEPVLTRATGLNAGTEIHLTDSTVRNRIAELFYVAPSSINFTVPADLVPGMVEISLLNADGPNLKGKMLTLPVSPGIFSATGNGRGPVIGFTVPGDLPTFTCDVSECATVPITVPTQLRLIGTGFRAAQAKDLVVTIGGRPAPIAFAGVFDDHVGTDQVIVSLGADFAGLQEVDLSMSFRELVSNSVRINIR